MGCLQLRHQSTIPPDSHKTLMAICTFLSTQETKCAASLPQLLSSQRTRERGSLDYQEMLGQQHLRNCTILLASCSTHRGYCTLAITTTTGCVQCPHLASSPPSRVHRLVLAVMVGRQRVLSCTTLPDLRWLPACCIFPTAITTESDLLCCPRVLSRRSLEAEHLRA